MAATYHRATPDRSWAWRCHVCGAAQRGYGCRDDAEVGYLVHNSRDDCRPPTT